MSTSTVEKNGHGNAHGGTKARARVLVVDDSLQMARMIADELEDHGFDAAACDHGKDAVDMLKGDDGDAIDAVVTDLRMPDVDGMQILAASKATAPDRPVIVMTAYSAVDRSEERRVG